MLQGETQKHLEKLKFDNEKTLLRLREEKVKIYSNKGIILDEIACMRDHHIIIR